MSVDIASLGIQVDSTQAKTASSNLDDLANSASSAQKAAEGTTGGFSKASDALGEFALHARAHTLAVLGASEGTRAFTGILAHLPLPLLAAAAAIAGLVKAYTDGRAEANAFANAVAASGNSAGVTIGQLTSIANQIGQVAGNSGKAAAALAALVATGAVGKDNLKDFATAAVKANETVGTSFADIAKEFQALADDPLQASIDLNKQLGQLTPALYQQIQALQQQGARTDAARLAQQAYSDSLRGQSAQLETYVSIWSRLGSSISNAYNAIKNIGRAPSPQDQLASLQAQRGSRPLGTLTPGFNTTQQLLNDRAEGILTDQIGQQNAQAEATRKQTEANKTFVESQNIANASLQAAISVSKALDSANLQGVQRAFTSAQAVIESQEQVLEAQHAALLVTDQQYYDAKAKLIAAGGQAEAEELAKEAAQVQKQIAGNATLFASLRASASSPEDSIRIDTQERTTEIALETQLANIQSKRATVVQETSSKIAALNIDEAASLKKLTDAYDDLYFSTTRYVDQLGRENALTEAGLGIGDQARQRASELAGIQDHFTQAQQALDDQLRQGSITQDQHDNRQQILQEGLANAEGAFKKHYQVLDQQQGDWLTGAKEALNNYVDAAKNVASLTDQAFTDAFKSIEDSIVTFATTGKFSFKDLADSILADLVRMEVKILESQALSSIFGLFGVGAGAGTATATSGVGDLLGSTVGFAAAGGNISGPTIVGEKGPELFVPSQSGTVIPNNKLGMGGGINIVNNNTFGAGADVAGISAQLDSRDAALKSDIYDSIRRNRWQGALAK